MKQFIREVLKICGCIFLAFTTSESLSPSNAKLQSFLFIILFFLLKATEIFEKKLTKIQYDLNEIKYNMPEKSKKHVDKW